LSQTQVNETGQKRKRTQYLLIGIGISLTVLFTAGMIYFWGDLQDVKSLAYRYGYLGDFVISFFGGISIIPVPTLLVTFTLGGILNPLYLGLVAGFGSALGGLTVYLTGVGGGAIWSRFRTSQQAVPYQPSLDGNNPTPAQSKPLSKWQTFYTRLVDFLRRRGISWALFITAAFVWALYYPVGLAAGTLRIGLTKFFLISWAGKTVRGLIVAYGGYWGLHILLNWWGG